MTNFRVSPTLLLVGFLLCVTLLSQFLYIQLAIKVASLEASEKKRSSIEATHPVEPHYKEGVLSRVSGLDAVTQRILRNLPDLSWDACIRFHIRKDCDSDDPDLPPCQRDILREMFTRFVNLSEKYDLEYFISYGTLLGATREKDIIAWTSDIDFGLDADGIQKLTDAIKTEQSHGRFLDWFLFKDPKYGPMHRICFTEYSPYNRWRTYLPQALGYRYVQELPYLDIYRSRSLFSAKNKTNVIMDFGPPCSFPREMIFPLKTMKVLGVDAKIPAQTEAMLKYIYGPTWQIPDGGKSMHGKYELNCNPEWLQ